MDSPPECVLSLSCEQLQSSPTLPSLDHSPQASSPHTQLSLPDSPVVLPIHSPEPSPHSPDSTPYFALSPFPLHHDNSNNQHDIDEEEDDDEDDDDDEDGLDGVPPSPTPAVALFPGGGGQDAGCLDSSPPATPSAPLLGFGALELALSSGQSGNCSDELDLQLFQKDTVTRAVPGVGGASSGPALRFPCHVCGKRFRFQSILSLHARAHSLDRDRRASALYRTGPASSPLKQPLKVQQNHKDIIQNHRSHLNQRLLTGPLIQHLTEEQVADDEVKALDDGVQTAQNPNFLLDESTPLTPPLTEDPVPITSPLFSNPSTIAEAASTPIAPTFRCHACKGKFRTASELARHVRILHNPYKCTLCPFSASQEESLASHIQESHPSPEVPTLTPALSSRSVIATPDTPVPTPTHTPAPTPSAPQSAATVTASSSLPAFRCDTCGQRFTQSWFLKGHMRKHKDSLDHKCQVCGRGFKEPWFLKNHMKVHLNKLGLKAGLGNLGGPASVEQLAKGSTGSQSLNALYSSLLLAQRGGGGGGGSGGRGRQGRSERGLSASKSAILGYLGLPGDGSGASCMERLQAVAQVAEMGNGGGSIGGSSGGDSVRGTTRAGAGENTALVSEGGDQTTWWQLVARSLAVAQQQQHRPQQRSHQGHRGTSRSSVITETDQVRTYLASLVPREETAVTGSAGGPWECPDCGKLFRSLQQVVVHARVHTQRPHKGGSAEEEGSGGHRGASVSRSSTGEVRQEPQLHGGGSQQEGAATGFHSSMSSFKGENGLTAVSSVSSAATRERMRGRGIKDCPYCGKAFRSSHHLKVHLRVHTGERPYKCPHCDYAGTQSGSLKYHLQRHHREQRNALSASSNTSSTSLTSTSGLAKQCRSQLNHCLGTRGPADGPNSAPSQQPWLMGLPDQREHRKALAALREVDLETQYRYLSGVMGALYQGGMEGGWIRESPPPKPAKVSRRKPLTTSRMVQPSNESNKEGSAPLNQEGGFEPLDLSRRPSPGFGGMEEDGVTSGGETAGVDGGDGGADSATGVKLSQCLFCPFRTSSGELMAMHLQVNHTSKSRRKRGSSTILEDDETTKVTQPRINHSDFDSMALWKHISDAKSHTSRGEWSLTQAQTHNGFSVDAAEQPEGVLNHSHSNLTSVSNLIDSPVLKGKVVMDDENLEQEEEENLVTAEDNSSLEGSPRLEQDLITLLPTLNSNHMVTEEEPVLTD